MSDMKTTLNGNNILDTIGGKKTSELKRAIKNFPKGERKKTEKIIIITEHHWGATW